MAKIDSIKEGTDFVGKWAFLIGFVLAVVLGAFGSVTGTWTVAFVVIGLVVGLLNVTTRETSSFLMSGAVLIIASALGGELLGSVNYVGSVLDALLAIFVPATVIVAVRNVFRLARD
ncbi:MAG: hypothetical protein U1B79_00060 [Candidatus Pacearchaeota archaeon]|nr:hypothetical protein [Candidatus Pacearchaeota archaeon]